MAQGEGGGRPLKFKSVKALQAKIDDYFDSCYDYQLDGFGNRIVDQGAGKDEEGNPYYVLKKVKAFTVTGLALHLETTRETLMDYEKGKYDDDGNLTEEQAKANKKIDRFSDTIKAAKLRCYDDTEQYLYRPGTATGAIFSLKNNYGWVDKTVTETENGPYANPFKDLSSAELKRLAGGDNDEA
jgi:hypothetical protein